MVGAGGWTTYSSNGFGAASNDEEVYLKAYENGTQAKKGLGDYFDFYNSRRRHQALNRRTPDEVYHQTRSLPQAA